MLSEIKELSDHMFWADFKIWREVKKLTGDKDIKPVFDLLFHLHMVQHAYLCIWNNLPLANFEKIKFENLSEVINWGMEFHKKYKEFLDSLENEKLNEPVNIPWTKHFERKIGKPPEESNLIQTIYQVILHSTYHRGQINSKIRGLGGEPPLTDYIYWVWTGKPSAETIT